MNVSDRTTAAQVISAFTSADAKAPKAVLAAYQDCQRVSAAARQLHPGRDTPGPAVAAALIAGHDPVTDPEVQRILIATELGGDGIPAQVDAVAFDLFGRVCAEHADDIVKSWAKVFDEAAATLRDAYARIGDLALDDTASVLVKGNDIADVWAAARKANGTIAAILGGWSALMQITGLASVGPRFRSLRLAEVLPGTGLAHQKLSAWDAVRAGLTLSLPTAGEFRQRVSRIVEAENLPETVIDRGRSHIAGREIRVETGRRAAVL